MKKKIVACMLAVVMTAAMAAGCGKKDKAAESAATADTVAVAEASTEAATESTTEAAAEASTDTLADEVSQTITAMDNTSVKKDGDTVTMTIPADYAAYLGISADNVASMTDQEGIKSADIDDNGNVVLVMTQDKHDAMMLQMKTDIDDDMESVASDGSITGLKSVTANDDYTTFTMTIDSDAVNESERLGAAMFYVYGRIYNVYDGNSDAEILVNIQNADGDVLETYNAEDAAAGKGLDAIYSDAEAATAASAATEAATEATTEAAK